MAEWTLDLLIPNLEPPLSSSQTLYQKTAPFLSSLDRLDMPALRQAFAALMDDAALAVQRAGFDLDDVVIERSLICRTARDRQVTVEAAWLSDGARQADAIRCILAPRPEDEPLHVAGVVVRAVRAALCNDQP